MKVRSYLAAAIASVALTGLDVASATLGAPSLCSQDYALHSSSGTPSYDAPPIEIVKQAGSYVDFVVRNTWSGLSSSNDLYVKYHDDDIGTSACALDSGLSSCEATVVMRAYCMKLVPITIVSVYVADSGLTSGDSAIIPECCFEDGTSQPTTTVEAYEFEINCEATCSSPQGPAGGCETRAPTDVKEVTPAPTETEDAMTVPPSKQPTKSPTRSPTKSPTKSPVAAECPVVTMDFDDLPEFGFVYNEWEETKGVKIIAQSDDGTAYTPLPKTGGNTLQDWNTGYWQARYKPSGWQSDNNTGGAARVFDTNKPNRNSYNGGKHNQPGCNTSGNGDGDKDLGSPHKDCPNGKDGPGVGNGGGPNSAHPNCPAKPINNVLVIQERQYEFCPDDEAGGGTITFEFNEVILGPVDIIGATFLDVDDNESVEIELFKSSGGPTTSNVPGTGDNGLITHYFDDVSDPSKLTGIRKVTFKYSGSGCIAEVIYKPTTCPTDASKGIVGSRRLSSTQTNLRNGNVSAVFGN